MNRRIAAVVLAACLCAPVAAAAQVNVPAIPPEIQNSPIVQSVLNAVGGLLQTSNGPTAHGRVTYFRRFDLQLETAPNVYRDVHLHQGTVIDPRGTTLAPGMVVDVSGSVAPDRSLAADRIVVHP